MATVKKNTVYEGAVSPQSLIANITPSDLVADLSVVTAATMKAYCVQSQVEKTWTCTMSNQTTTTLRLTHEFAAGELDQPGQWVWFAVLTVPTGTIESTRLAFQVLPKYQVI